MASRNSVMSKTVAKTLKKYLDIQRREQSFDLSDPYHPVREPTKKIKVKYNNFLGFDSSRLTEIEKEIQRFEGIKNLSDLREVETKMSMEREMARFTAPLHVVSPYAYTSTKMSATCPRKKRKPRLLSAGRVGRGQKVYRRAPPEKITAAERERIVNITTKLLVATENIALPANRTQSKESQTWDLPLVRRAASEVHSRPQSAPSDRSYKKSPIYQHHSKVRATSIEISNAGSDDFEYQKSHQSRIEDNSPTTSDYSPFTSTDSYANRKKNLQNIDGPRFLSYNRSEVTSQTSENCERVLSNNISTQTVKTAETQTAPRDYLESSSSGDTESLSGNSDRHPKEDVDYLLSLHSNKSLGEMSTQTRRKSTENKVITYEVYVVTGNKLGSSTAANVAINIFGEYGNTGDRQLHKSTSSQIPFQRNQVDIFHLDCMFLGRLANVRIGHNGGGLSDGWFLEKVVIKEGAQATRAFSFECKRWFSAKEDDGQLVRDLPMTRQVHISEIPLPAQKSLKAPSGERMRKMTPNVRSSSASRISPLQSKINKSDVSTNNREYFDKNEKSDSDLSSSRQSSSPEKLPYIRKKKSVTRKNAVSSAPNSSSDSDSQFHVSKPRRPRVRQKANERLPDTKPKANLSGLVNKVNLSDHHEPSKVRPALITSNLTRNEEKRNLPPLPAVQSNDTQKRNETVKNSLNISLSSDSSSSSLSSTSSSSDDDNNAKSNNSKEKAEQKEKVEEKNIDNDRDDEKVEFSNKVTEKKYSESTDDDKYMAGFLAGIKANKSKEESERKESVEKQAFEENLKKGSTIHQAAEDGDLDRLKELISLVPELKNKPDERGWTPIHICSAFGHLDLVKWLSVSGVHLTEETPTGYTAIHLAAMNGHVNCIMILAAMGCPISSRTVDGFTPLHLASMSGHIECLKWLLSNRAKVDVKDANERTPLDLAKEYQHEECIKLLKIMKKELGRKDSILKVLRDPNALRKPSVDYQTRMKGPDSGVGGESNDDEEEWRSDAEESSDVIGRGGDDRPEIARKTSIQGRRLSTATKPHPTGRPQMQRKISKQDMRYQSDLAVKKKAYEEQSRKTEKRRMSFLDSIRMDVEQEP